MADLPRTVKTAEGLTVEGASPELLRELLAEYEAELRFYFPEMTDGLLPGASRGEIQQAFATLGFEPNEEVITLWEWHNGLAPGTRREPVRLPWPLETAVRWPTGIHRGITSQPDELTSTWHPGWVPWSERAAVRADRVQTPPPVRANIPELGTHTQEAVTPFDVLSLCTPFTWAIMALREGWMSRDDYPADWWNTHLI